MKIFTFRMILTVLVAVAACLFFSVISDVEADDAAAQFADHFLNKKPVPDVAGVITLEGAMKIQADYVALISKEYGPPIGYKAGLTNVAVQERFGVSHPLRGTLLEKMFFKTGVELEASFGVRPFHEGDLILRVGDESINQAESIEDVIRYVDAAIPLIELPDIIFSKQVKIDGPALAAINVAARYGVVGEPVPIEATAAWIERLKNFKLQILDENAKVLAEGTGSSLLDHPLNVVLWLRDSMLSEGMSLKKGDLLSLGTITKLMPAKAGTTIRAVYIGLDPGGPVEVSVKFK
jgi:2-keto-4-pentenoate hydratase